jgi:hypothetical protein
MISFAFLAAHALACTADLLVDDFAKINLGQLPGDLATDPKRDFNLLGGDYGSAGATFTIDTAAKSLTIVASTANIGQPEPAANPGTSPTVNYWYCF